MGKTRKTHSPDCTTKVALTALQNDETPSQRASRFRVQPTMGSSWKRQMVEDAAAVSDKNTSSKKPGGSQLLLSPTANSTKREGYLGLPCPLAEAA
ncbi:hypothetical protein CSB45_12555 [candidate division KSB3 bacterium]|uniref:Transposase n=1 Tax=candidate division KSB3 bacterium TaxID=2044937 RepID=A0A2G6E2C7_9BACT|nr:MAG: hypothetical protein CSB45_12555 [candidate division KSB3 bacterium]PIE28723.1 MAG: hypothetical protein CSA57_12535 [candidate division KSB3 bacterium]